jgi:hypothetical protein
MPMQVRVEEAGDPGDPTCANDQHVDPGEPEAVASRLPMAPGERRLPGRPGRPSGRATASARSRRTPWRGGVGLWVVADQLQGVELLAGEVDPGALLEEEATWKPAEGRLGP